MHARNLILKEQLREGHPVQFRCWGLSMYPRVLEGDCCIFEPVVVLSKLRIGDLVFCQTQPDDNFFARTISWALTPSVASARDGDGDIGTWKKYGIATQKGKHVGHCYGNNIYGRLVEVIHARTCANPI